MFPPRDHQMDDAMCSETFILSWLLYELHKSVYQGGEYILRTEILCFSLFCVQKAICYQSFRLNDMSCMNAVKYRFESWKDSHQTYIFSLMCAWWFCTNRNWTFYNKVCELRKVSFREVNNRTIHPQTEFTWTSACVPGGKLLTEKCCIDCNNGILLFEMKHLWLRFCPWELVNIK